MIMTYVKVKGQSRSNVVKNVLLLPTLARRITKQVKDDDYLYEGQRLTEVISGQGTCHRDDTVMSSCFCCTILLIIKINKLCSPLLVSISSVRQLTRHSN